MADSADAALASAQNTAVLASAKTYDDAVKSGKPPDGDTIKSAVVLGAGAAGAAACAATGVGLAAAPLCGAVASAIAGTFVGLFSRTGPPFLETVQKMIKDATPPTFVANVAAAPFSDTYIPTQQTHFAMLTSLDAAVDWLRGVHAESGIGGTYDDETILEHLRDVHGLPLITTGSAIYQVPVPDPNNPGHLMPSNWERRPGVTLEPPDITADWQKINQASGRSWVEKGNQAKYLIALGFGWLEALKIAAGREAVIINALRGAKVIADELARHASDPPPTPVRFDAAFVAVSGSRAQAQAGIVNGVTFLHPRHV